MTVVRSNSGRLGFSLLEMLAVIACLGIALSLGAVVLIAAMRSNQVAAGTLLHMRLRAEIADAFRSDVAAADSLPDRDGAAKRGPSCLILKKADGEHVVYEWRDGQLVRILRTSDGESRSLFSLQNSEASVVFPVADGKQNLVSLVFVESPSRGTIRRWEITAALGGDRR